jgi:hypothetical protein
MCNILFSNAKNHSRLFFESDEFSILGITFNTDFIIFVVIGNRFETYSSISLKEGAGELVYLWQSFLLGAFVFLRSGITSFRLFDT